MLIYLKQSQFLPFFFRATPAAYGSSWVRGQIGAAAASLCHSHSNARSEPHLQTLTQLVATPDPLTHWARPGIEPASSWILVGFLTCWAATGNSNFCLLIYYYYYYYYYYCYYYYYFGHNCSMWKFPGQRWNPHQSSDLSTAVTMLDP